MSSCPSGHEYHGCCAYLEATLAVEEAEKKRGCTCNLTKRLRHIHKPECPRSGTERKS